MRTLGRTEFSDEAYTVIRCACERCGAPGPCVTSRRYDDHAIEMLRVRSGMGGCCGPCVLRHIRRGARGERKAAV